MANTADGRTVLGANVCFLLSLQALDFFEVLDQMQAGKEGGFRQHHHCKASMALNGHQTDSHVHH